MQNKRTKPRIFWGQSEEMQAILFFVGCPHEVHWLDPLFKSVFTYSQISDYSNTAQVSRTLNAFAFSLKN